MGIDFADLNAYVYYSARGAVMDVLIWCLGPYVDEKRTYGLCRHALAAGTSVVLRPWCRRHAEDRTGR